MVATESVLGGERASRSASGIYRDIAIESLESEEAEGAIFGSFLIQEAHEIEKC